MNRLSLGALPVELLYEVQLYALSEALPLVCCRLHEIFKSAPPSYNAQYLLAKYNSSGYYYSQDPISLALRFPICNKSVLEAFFRIRQRPRTGNRAPELPRRLFRSLAPKVMNGPGGTVVLPWSEDDEPLPFLKYLYSCPNMAPPFADSHSGYALTKAVHAGFVPLVRFLLDNDASPGRKDGLAVMVAIRRRDLGLVKMLVERGEGKVKGNAKKRRLGDRVTVSTAMLRTAVKCDARDIVQYLTQEKGCVPDMKTLLAMRR